MSILKVVIPAFLILGAVGCVDIVEKQDLDDLSTQVDKLKAQVAQKNDMQALLYEELVKRTNGLEKKVGGGEPPHCGDAESDCINYLTTNLKQTDADITVQQMACAAYVAEKAMQ